MIKIIIMFIVGTLLSLPVFSDTKEQIINLTVTENGFEPNKIDLKPGSHLILKVIRKTNSTCATAIKIPSKKVTQELPLNKEVKIDLGVLKKGEIKFMCGMDMLGGIIDVK